MIPTSIVHKKVGCYFKPYTRMAIRETMLLVDQKEEDRRADRIAVSSLTSDIYGVTMFEKLFISNAPETAVTNLKDKALQTVVANLILRPTSKNFLIGTAADFKSLIVKKGMRPDYRRNIVQKCLRFLVVSDDNEANDKITRRVEMFLELFGH